MCPVGPRPSSAESPAPRPGLHMAHPLESAVTNNHNWESVYNSIEGCVCTHKLIIRCRFSYIRKKITAHSLCSWFIKHNILIWVWCLTKIKILLMQHHDKILDNHDSLFDMGAVVSPGALHRITELCWQGPASAGQRDSASCPLHWMLYPPHHYPVP